MCQAKARRHLTSVWPLVVALVAKAHAEAGDGDAARPRRIGHECGNGARVDATRQEDAERHVRHHLAVDRRGQRVTHSTGRVFFRPRPYRRLGHVPVALHAYRALAVDHVVRSGQAAHLREERARRDHVLVGQELIERLQIELARHFRPHQQRLHFRGEEQAAAACRRRTAASRRRDRAPPPATASARRTGPAQTCRAGARTTSQPHSSYACSAASMSDPERKRCPRAFQLGA